MMRSRTTIPQLVGIGLMIGASVASGQSQKPNAAYYITKEEVDAVNKAPGIDRTIRVMDIGDQHFAVGVIHRGPIPAPAAAPASTPATPAANSRPCGTAEANAPKDLTPGLHHDKQTEGYYVISGEGTLVTGGHIVNGRTEAPDSEVTTVLNGPSCRGGIGGADVVKRFVKTGDIVIIPAGVPHGWAEVKDHVDYVSFRPSSDILTVGYVHPAIKK
jgi:mannose-6-phosphate isomerase-like protein (cupin superfamily)